MQPSSAVRPGSSLYLPSAQSAHASPSSWAASPLWCLPAGHAVQLSPEPKVPAGQGSRHSTPYDVPVLGRSSQTMWASLLAPQMPAVAQLFGVVPETRTLPSVSGVWK